MIVLKVFVGRFARVGEGRVKPMSGLSIHCGFGVAVGIIVLSWELFMSKLMSIARK